MPHAFEPAASGRSKCRACGKPLAKGEWRFGERLPSPFADGAEITLWFHPRCAAYKRCEAVLEALANGRAPDDLDALKAIASAIVDKPRVARIDGAGRAKGVATCRHCREPIERGAWRIRISMFDEGMLNPLGFVHLACGAAYCEGGEILERVLHFSGEMAAEDRAALEAELGGSIRAALAPTGKLRVGVYIGSPTSYVTPQAGGEPGGVGYEVGREMARRLGVPFQPEVFPSNAKLYDAFREGKVDVLLTNATEERKRFIDFSDPVLLLEKSYLVGPGSRIVDAKGLGREGVRIGVSQGSTTSRELSRILPHATFVQAPSLAEGRRMLADGRIDAYSSNKAILHEMGDGLPGSRVVAGRWDTESFALGVPQGREAGHAWLNQFAKSIRAEGFISRAASHAGVRGTVE